MNTPKSAMALAAWSLVILAGCVVLWLVVHRLFFLPAENAANKARAVIAEEATTATGEAAGAALGTVREVRTEYHRIDEITRSNEHAIKSAPGADTRVPDVSRALVRGLCLHRTYIDEPGCAAVLGDGEGVGPAGSDNGSAASR